MRREKKTRQNTRWQLPPDNRLRLHPPALSLKNDLLGKDAADFEVEFFERILERDPCHEEALRLLGYIYTARGEYRKGLAMDQRLVRLRPEDAAACYNLACSYSLVGEVDKAMEALCRAICLGFRNWEEIDTDPDLANLRKDPRYQLLRQQHQTNK